MTWKKSTYSTFIFFFWGLIAYAQKPHLQFLQDSLGIGKTAEVSLSFAHPSNQDVFFAKSPELFSPFQLLSVNPTETRTNGDISVDSVLYTIKSFEINTFQTLRLPIWQIIDGDSIRVFSNFDTLFFDAQIPDSLLSTAEFKIRTNFIPSSSKINYPLILRWFLGIVLFVAFFVLFLRMPLERLFLKWKFRRRHYKFTQQFRKSMKTAEELPSSMDLWKNHMEWLDDKPYTTLSTSEITKQSGDERLGEALKEIDGAIYGGIASDRILMALQLLYNEALEKYKTKRQNYYKSLK